MPSGGQIDVGKMFFHF